MANVCPCCGRRLSEGYYYLELHEEFVSPVKAQLGAIVSESLLASACCGEVRRGVQLYPTMLEARHRRDQLDTSERFRLPTLKVLPVSSLTILV